MKNIYIIICLSIFSFAFSQSDDTMVKSEMIAASKIIDFKVNPNTQNYDITYHKLEFTVDPAVANINGKVTTTYTALSNMTTLTFDLYNSLIVSSVKINGVSASFVQPTVGNDQLVITLPSTQIAGTSASSEIIYSGNPTSSGFGSFTVKTHGTGAARKPVLYTLSEPYGARDWWPCKQDLNDKIDNIDVYITAPSAYIAVSNGIETTLPVIVGANKTTHFHHGHPIPAYLIAIAVTNYSVFNQVAGLGTTASPNYPVINYSYPETKTANEASIAITPTILNFYESIIGPYAFRDEKYGLCQFGWGGGMEHTTVSFMTAGGSGAYSRSLIAHETAHQWFGDKITCGSWKDIWLNEGITEYMSGCVVENLDGATSFVNWKNNKIASITSAPEGHLYLNDDDLTNVDRIFDGRLTYDKGSMVSNMLRFKMGDTNYFQGLRNYLADTRYAYGYAVTPDFQAKMETLFGVPGSLQEFFNDWVYNEGFPTYTVNVTNSGAGQASIKINQTQSITDVNQVGYVSFFEMPVPIRLTGAAGQILDVVLDNTTNGQIFNVPVSFVVTGVVFDPNKNIISLNNSTTLGTGNFELETATSIYPNPSSDILNINLPTYATLEVVNIYNSLGQKVIAKNSGTVFVNNLSNGIYQIEVITSEGTIHKKFIKK